MISLEVGWQSATTNLDSIQCDDQAHYVAILGSGREVKRWTVYILEHVEAVSYECERADRITCANSEEVSGVHIVRRRVLLTNDEFDPEEDNVDDEEKGYPRRT